jgi:hypothetical protein
VLDIWLRYEGDGIFKAIRESVAACATHYRPGSRVRARMTQPRTLDQNALFHAAIQRAFDNQRAGPVFDNWEQLKGYLKVKAGWSDEKRVSAKEFSGRAIGPFGKALAQALRWQSNYVSVSFDPVREEIVLRFPRTTRHATISEMSGLLNAVSELIAEEIVPGVEIKQLFELAASDAA